MTSKLDFWNPNDVRKKHVPQIVLWPFHSCDMPNVNEYVHMNAGVCGGQNHVLVPHGLIVLDDCELLRKRAEIFVWRRHTLELIYTCL